MIHETEIPPGERLPVSVVVLTFNESRNIERCLRSLESWAGEVWVVDSGSTDDTLEKVSRFTSHVTSHPFENYAAQRNWAHDHLPLAHEWVFHLDADEAVSPALADSIRAFLRKSDLSAYAGAMVRRCVQFLGRELRHGGLYPTYHCRLFRRSAGRCETRDYDQHFLVQGRLATLRADIVENTAPTLEGWTARHNRWAQMEARHLFRHAPGESSDGQVKGTLGGNPIEQRRWLRSSFYGRMPRFLRAFMLFAYRYVIRGGFLDGRPGLIYHVLQGLWFRFYTDACLYEMDHKAREGES